MSAATKVRVALERAEAELPHLAAPDGTVAIAIDDLRAVIDEMTAMRDTLALGKRHWRERWYGSDPQRGSSVCATTEHGLHGEVIAYLGGDEETHKEVRKLVLAHNAAMMQAGPHTLKALVELEAHLRDTPHHNAPEAAFARQAIRHATEQPA